MKVSQIKKIIRLHEEDATQETDEDGLPLTPPAGLNIGDIGGADTPVESDEDPDNILNATDDTIRDKDKQGLIRRIPKAHLVYKRQQGDGTYTELWSYNVEGFRETQEVRQQILSGTDVDATAHRSEDGSQVADIWQSGNVELLQITGLPN